MAKYYRNNQISLLMQQIRIKQLFKNVISICCKKNKLIVVMNICPSENSNVYKVKIIYTLDKKPIVLLLSPKLQKVNGKKPHHLYHPIDGYPNLCLFYNKEWTKQKYIAETIIPWISTWLLAYEFWLITGQWHYEEIVKTGKKKSQ